VSQIASPTIPQLSATTKEKGRDTGDGCVAKLAVSLLVQRFGRTGQSGNARVARPLIAARCKQRLRW
jgi:hypothetical protein